MSSDAEGKPKSKEPDISIQELECASCHAPIKLYSESTKFKRCEYCGFVNYIVRDAEGYRTSKDKTSTISKFRGFSDLQLGGKLTIDGEPYLIIGCMRYVSKNSIWYEILIKNTNTKKEFYMSFEEGQYILYEKMKKTGITRDQLDGGSHVTRYGTMELYEKGKAKISEFDGEIPFLISKDEELEWFDGMIGRRKFSIEAVKDEFEVYFGDPVIKVKPGEYKKGGKVIISKETGFSMERNRAIAVVVVIVIIAAIFISSYLLTGTLFFIGDSGGGAMGSRGDWGGGGGGGGKMIEYIFSQFLIK